MVKFIIILLVVALISNSTGDDIAKRLKKRYESNKMKCSYRGKDKPAYQCSGIMLRSVSAKQKYPWYMKDLNKKKKAFSLSYLRQDHKFSKIAWNYVSGFIIYPHLTTPKKKNTYKVYCSFPLDGWTDSRKGHGCGQAGGNVRSRHCHKQGIKSFGDWVKKFKNAVLRRQCAFDMTTKSATKNFQISIEATRYIKKRFPGRAYAYNELRMHSWNDKKAKNIPIEAFFYVSGSATGKRAAQTYQDLFYSHGGGVAPIVSIRFPSRKKSFKVEYVKRKPKKIKK